jgi:hypothetical protein
MSMSTVAVEGTTLFALAPTRADFHDLILAQGLLAVVEDFVPAQK